VGGEGPEKEPEIDAEAVSKGKGEPDETMPEPEEPAGTKPGLQELPGTKNGSPGGRQTRSMTDALLRVDDTEVGKSKFSVVMPKGFRIDPQYQRIQGFNFGDFPPLGGGVSKETTSNVTKGAGETPSEDMEIVKQPEEEVELGSRTVPNPKGIRPQWKVFLTFLPPSCLQKRRQPLRSRSTTLLPSANPDLALRTWLRQKDLASRGVSRL
jgi:hypothetical protein